MLMHITEIDVQAMMGWLVVILCAWVAGFVFADMLHSARVEEQRLQCSRVASLAATQPKARALVATRDRGCQTEARALADFLEFTIDVLRGLCRDRNLSTQGRKEDVAARLVLQEEKVRYMAGLHSQ